MKQKTSFPEFVSLFWKYYISVGRGFEWKSCFYIHATWRKFYYRRGSLGTTSWFYLLRHAEDTFTHAKYTRTGP